MGNDWKPERVDSGWLIPGAKNSFSQASSVADIQMMEAEAPPDHRVFTDAIVASGKVRAPVQREEVDLVRPQKVKPKVFARGARVTAISGKGRGKKLTIIKANVGETNKTHTPVHRVADEDGNVWLEVESKIQFR
jgi:hypothetical protein